MIDYHIHTALCNHATGRAEDYIRQAVRAGLKEIGFLEHLTLQEGGRHLSLHPAEVPLYFHALQEFKWRYADRIQVRIGLEIDYDPRHRALIEDLVGSLSFDLIGGSVHFVRGINIVSKKYARRNESLDIDLLYAAYWDELEKMLEFQYYDVICHLDVVKKFGRRPARNFGARIDALLARIQERGLVVEFNTSGYDHPVGEAYPAPAILGKCREKGIRITLGSDAHTPDTVARAYDRAGAELRAAGYSRMVAFAERKPKSIPIEGPGLTPGRAFEGKSGFKKDVPL